MNVKLIRPFVALNYYFKSVEQFCLLFLIFCLVILINFLQGIEKVLPTVDPHGGHLRRQLLVLGLVFLSPVLVRDTLDLGRLVFALDALNFLVNGMRLVFLNVVDLLHQELDLGKHAIYHLYDL